jgi:hypothetical protein
MAVRGALSFCRGKDNLHGFFPFTYILSEECFRIGNGKKRKEE